MKSVHGKISRRRKVHLMGQPSFFKAFAFLTACFCMLGYHFFGLIGILLGIVAGCACGVVVSVMADQAGDLAARVFYRGGRASWTPREQAAGDLDRAKYLKSKGRFSPALRMVNSALKKSPDYPETLFLKAHILWEGFGNAAAARACLEKVLRATADTESGVYRWAGSLLKELAHKAPPNDSRQKTAIGKEQEKP